VADAGAIATLHVEVAREVYADLIPPECLTAFGPDDATARRDIENPRHFVAVGVGGGEKIVGYADGGIYAPGDGALLEIWVRAECRGTGIGPELFRRVLRELRARGCNRLVLVVAEGLSRARDFYSRKLGGVVLGPVEIALGYDVCAELPGTQYGWPDLSGLEARLDDLLA
jgi:ribosomal protein S18 acetylase RimI-like enzyme